MPPVGDGAGDTLPETPVAARRPLTFWLKIAVSLALLAYQLRRGGLDNVGAALSSAKPLWVLASFALYVASHWLNAVRWYHYAGSFGFAGGRVDYLRPYFAGLFLNLFAPGTVAGDVSRGLAIGGKKRRAAAFGSVLAHRISGMVALIALTAVAALVQDEYRLPPLARAAAAIAPVAAVAVLLGAPSAVGAIAALLGRSVWLPRAWIAATAQSLAIAVVFHGMQIVSTILLARALAIDVAAATMGLFVPLINAAGMIPVTVSGVGVREAGYVILLRLIGVAEEKSLALGLLGSAVVFATGLVGAPAFLRGAPASRDGAGDSQ